MSDCIHHTVVRIRRIDEAKRVVFGGVYPPNTLDTYGEFMFAEDIETMCHRFAQLSLGEVIDTNHDNIPNGSFPVESFIARAADPDFAEGEWVLGIKVPDDHVWAQVLKGELNGFSFEALVKPVPVRVKFQLVRDHVGRTESDDNDHSHVFFAQVDDNGRVSRGTTSFDAGHSHLIRHASSTERAGEDRHTHRFFL